MYCASSPNCRNTLRHKSGDMSPRFMRRSFPAGVSNSNSAPHDAQRQKETLALSSSCTSIEVGVDFRQPRAAAPHSGQFCLFRAIFFLPAFLREFQAKCRF